MVYKDPDWKQTDNIKSYNYVVRKLKPSAVREKAQDKMEKFWMGVAFYHNAIVEKQTMEEEGFIPDRVNQVNYLTEKFTIAGMIMERFPLPVKSMSEEEELYIKRIPRNQEEAEAFSINHRFMKAERNRIKGELNLLR